MRICLLSVGKPKDRLLASVHDRYAARIGRLGVEYGARWVAEVRAGGRFSDEHVREREGRSLLDGGGPAGVRIALDPGGTLLTTEALARRLERWALPLGTFLVGGPLGLHAEVRERSDERWSLSPLTLPHELVRVVVVEQIYRALTILRGLPYHK